MPGVAWPHAGFSLFLGEYPSSILIHRTASDLHLCGMVEARRRAPSVRAIRPGGGSGRGPHPPGAVVVSGQLAGTAWWPWRCPGRCKAGIACRWPSKSPGTARRRGSRSCLTSTRSAPRRGASPDTARSLRPAFRGKTARAQDHPPSPPERPDGHSSARPRSTRTPPGASSRSGREPRSRRPLALAVHQRNFDLLEIVHRARASGPPPGDHHLAVRAS